MEKIKKIKLGDRVKCEDFLGFGKVVEIVRSHLDSRIVIGYLILLDKNPDKRYNMGENPCFMLKGQVTRNSGIYRL